MVLEYAELTRIYFSIDGCLNTKQGKKDNYIESKMDSVLPHHMSMLLSLFFFLIFIGV